MDEKAIEMLMIRIKMNVSNYNNCLKQYSVRLMGSCRNIFYALIFGKSYNNKEN